MFLLDWPCLAAANLLALAHRLTRSEQFVWVLIVAAAVVFHPTHLIMIIALIIGAVLALMFRYRVSRVGIVALIFSAGIGVASEFAFSQAIEKVLGVQTSRPPVLMARMIAHGAGTSFLKEKCPEAGMVVCEFVDRLTSNSDAFLWDTSPATGIYRPASIENRRRLGNEQLKFAVAVLGHDPMGQIAASIQDTYQQFMMVGLTTFRSAAYQAHSSLPAIHSERMTHSVLASQDFPTHIFNPLTIIVLILSTVFISATLLWRWNNLRREYKIFCLVVFFGISANAFICGALSGPHERYQSRLTWLVPLLALLLCYEIWVGVKDGRSRTT